MTNDNEEVSDSDTFNEEECEDYEIDWLGTEEDLTRFL